MNKKYYNYEYDFKYNRKIKIDNSVKKNNEIKLYCTYYGYFNFTYTFTTILDLEDYRKSNKKFKSTNQYQRCLKHCLIEEKNDMKIAQDLFLKIGAIISKYDFYEYLYGLFSKLKKYQGDFTTESDCRRELSLSGYKRYYDDASPLEKQLDKLGLEYEKYVFISEKDIKKYDNILAMAINSIIKNEELEKN